MVSLPKLLSESLSVDLSPIIDLDAPSWAPDDSPRQVACYRLRESLLKKFNSGDKPSVPACEAALSKFLSVNERVGRWGLELNHDYEAELIQALSNELHSSWTDHGQGEIVGSYSDLFSAGRSGPGASLCTRYTDFYRKFYGSRHSVSSDCADLWHMLIRNNLQFSSAFLDAEVPDVSIRDYNRLSFVNKTTEIARTICTEPFGNMWLQLGLGSILETMLEKRYNIRMSLQPDVNRALALRGSSRDDLVTIDLESASDSLGLSMLSYVLPKSLLAYLVKLRSRSTQLPDGSFKVLQMVSTMGNGFTFPLQTFLFVAICVTVYRYLGLKLDLWSGTDKRNVAVFGDDIIVDKRAAPLVMKLLKLLGFVINDSKTFVEGPFRESCGVDAFLGVNVRPVYIKRLASQQDLFVAINRLNFWSAMHAVPLRETIRTLLGSVRRVTPIPFDESDDAGIKMPLYHSGAKCVASVPGLYRYTAYVPAKAGVKVRDDGQLSDGSPTNLRGLEIAAVGGYIRRNFISVRQPKVKYKTIGRCTPRWDYMPTAPWYPSIDGTNIRHLVSAVRDNLFD